jgi:hypothetical protein
MMYVLPAALSSHYLKKKEEKNGKNWCTYVMGMYHVTRRRLSGQRISGHILKGRKREMAFLQLELSKKVISFNIFLILIQKGPITCKVDKSLKKIPDKYPSHRNRMKFFAFPPER